MLAGASVCVWRVCVVSMCAVRVYVSGATVSVSVNVLCGMSVCTSVCVSVYECVCECVFRAEFCLYPRNRIM